MGINIAVDFKSLLENHCKKIEVAMNFELHKTHEAYKHDSNLFFVLKNNTVAVFTSDNDWLFSFTDVKILEMFITSLTLNCKS